MIMRTDLNKPIKQTKSNKNNKWEHTKRINKRK